jgi:hypothetical protein
MAFARRADGDLPKQMKECSIKSNHAIQFHSKRIKVDEFPT